MSVTAIHQTSKPHEIAKRLNAQYRAIEKSSEEMGRDLVLLKRSKAPGIEWGIYLKEFGIEFSREYADRLIRRVEPKKPIEPKPAPEPSSEPDIEIFKESPEPQTIILEIESPEASAEAMKAQFAELDSANIEDDHGSQTKEPARAEVAKLVRARVAATPEVRRQFVRERWDEIARARKQLDANGAPAEDRWIEGDTL